MASKQGEDKERGVRAMGGCCVRRADRVGYGMGVSLGQRGGEEWIFV